MKGFDQTRTNGHFCPALRGVLAASALMVSLPSESSADDGQITLPSGLTVHLQEMLWDRPGSGLVYRFRFVAPDFGPDTDIGAVSEDLEFLCNSYALPRLASTGPQPKQIVMSLANKSSEFGVYDPDVKQIFETFRVEGESCVWELF